MQKIFNQINQYQIAKAVGLLLVFIIITTLSAHAQPPDAGGDVNAPIDGGLSLLVAAGVGYGAKKLKARRKISSKKLD